MKLLLKRLGLALGGVVLLLLALEGALRVGAMFTRVRFDPAEPRAGALRILCVGDSNTYGLHQNPELRSYPAILRQRLRKLSPAGFQVANRGVPGWATGQMRAALPAFLEELRPQVVLLLGGINNTWNVGDGAGFDRWLLQHSALAHFLRIVAARWRGTQRFRLEQKDASSLEVETADGSSTVHGSPLAAADDAALLAQSTRADLRAMIALVRASGAWPILMTYASEAEPPFVTVNEVARDLSRELEVPLVDHGADFRARFREQGGYAALMYASDHHPNARGYALMVDAILARFRALNLIDRLPPPLEAPAPKLDQRVALSCDAAGELKLAAPVGFIFDVLLSTRRDPPIAFGGITLPIGIDEKISLKANDVPQLRGRVEREWTSITIPRELLDVPELYAAAVLFDDDAVVRAVSACIAVER